MNRIDILAEQAWKLIGMFSLQALSIFHMMIHLQFLTRWIFLCCIFKEDE